MKVGVRWIVYYRRSDGSTGVAHVHATSEASARFKARDRLEIGLDQILEVRAAAGLDRAS